MKRIIFNKNQPNIIDFDQVTDRDIVVVFWENEIISITKLSRCPSNRFYYWLSLDSTSGYCDFNKSIYNTISDALQSAYNYCKDNYNYYEFLVFSSLKDLGEWLIKQ